LFLSYVQKRELQEIQGEMAVKQQNELTVNGEKNRNICLLNFKVNSADSEEIWLVAF
jgi:hypothetical protein